MMKDKKISVILVVVAALAAVLLIRSTPLLKQDRGAGDVRVAHPVIGDVFLTVASTGVVEPQNRLEIKPSISGRIERILVKEGDDVKRGDVLAWMSSTERAALVDAARLEGEDALKYWEEVYKQTPVISPIDGGVIVRSVEPGQTITASDAILVLSDRLVVSAQFDETDIGRVKAGQKAFITLDAYPDVKIEGTVDHIAYESKIVNNVTIYDVDILPEDIPEILRSGMSVTVEVVEKSSEGVITIPSAAVHYDKKRAFVRARERLGRIVERDIEVGLNDEKTAEVVSGLTPEDKIEVPDTAYLPRRKSGGTNPFMPFGKRK